MPPLPPPPIRGARRVVVTGIGIVSPLACGARSSWERLNAGRSGLSALQGDLGVGPSKVAARVPRGTGPDEFDLDAVVGKANMRTQGVDFIGMAMFAAKEALEDAALVLRGGGTTSTPHVQARKAADSPLLHYDPDRVGVAIGSGVGNIAEIGATAAALAGSSASGNSCGGDSASDLDRLLAAQRRVSPFFVPRVLTNMAAGHVSIRWQLRGPNHSVSTACATGAHAIGDAFRFIKYGDADAMLAGGTEACINNIALTGFSRAKALATAFNEDPQAASRPFDVRRDGFVLGEGAGVLLLEELGAARARGARIYAEVRGYGLGGDAFHITSPREDGSGALRCMRAALAEGGLTPEDVDYVNAHATSTPLGDTVEATALGALFRGVGGGAAIEPVAVTGDPSSTPAHNTPSLQRRARRVAVSSTKGAIGHLLGAAGSVEAAFTVLAIAEGLVPPTLNLSTPDPGLPIDVCEFVGGTAGRRQSVRAALTNSFGFGGVNCSLLFTDPPTC